MKNILVSAIVAVVVVLIGFAVYKPATLLFPPLGAAAGPDHYNQENFYGGLKNGTVVATSSAGTAITLKASEMRGWINASLVSIIPNLAGETLTLPASSTIADVVPLPGDRQQICLLNATTTAGTPIILAGATGLNLVAASSTATAVGSLQLATGKVGCITFIREPKTSSKYDIDALLTVYQ